ncbi:FAD-dependent oxidoreductase [Serpentinicella alkaliphila]|uniref:FAD binding domain-containing protein n=1 Tax=Serpentinicella alkaliphila TaxID=1734049 RepID=A0A4R2TL92_9FIRM|nr:FAD-binding protein [Serpentinicella alkaliphila]TCQ03257.1 FAD binding domain-containing protein [Serpentinicella alkaliphila]
MLDGNWIAPKVELVREFATNALDAFAWMEEVDLQATYGTNAKYGGNVGTGTVLGAMWPRTHSFMTGAERISQLAKVAIENGVTIYTETRGTELIVSQSARVVGAKAVQADGTQITINATKGVVLATGGYSANVAMVKSFDK